MISSVIRDGLAKDDESIRLVLEIVQAFACTIYPRQIKHETYLHHLRSISLIKMEHAFVSTGNAQSSRTSCSSCTRTARLRSSLRV